MREIYLYIYIRGTVEKRPVGKHDETVRIHLCPSQTPQEAARDTLQVLDDSRNPALSRHCLQQVHQSRQAVPALAEVMERDATPHRNVQTPVLLPQTMGGRLVV